MHSLMFTAVHLGTLSVLESNKILPDHLMGSHLIASALSASFSYPLDYRYTVRAAGGVLPFSNLKTNMYKGISLSMMCVPVSVLGSLSWLSFMSLVFPEPGPFAGPLDYARGVAVGTTAAVVGSSLVYPMDTLRRRVILGSSFWEARKLGKLFCGFSIHLMKAVPECALITGAYLVNLRYWASIG